MFYPALNTEVLALVCNAGANIFYQCLVVFLNSTISYLRVGGWLAILKKSIRAWHSGYAIRQSGNKNIGTQVESTGVNGKIQR